MNTINPIIELYSKFLMAFISIVTPALTLYLNSFLIHRTKFDKIIKDLKSREKDQQDMLDFQSKLKQSNFDSSDIEEKIRSMKSKTEKWLYVVNELSPMKFFKSNVFLLGLSLISLFGWLFVRSGKWFDTSTECYMTMQILIGCASIGFCLLHIYNLVSMGVFLIEARPIVDDINEEIDNAPDGSRVSPGQ